jgi:hypothetical protein
VPQSRRTPLCGVRLTAGEDGAHHGRMLLNLLPGLRDLRTPLATGYVWLVTLWLALHDRIPDRGHAHGAALSLYQLHDAIGQPASFAAASFLAYVVGQVQVAPDGRWRFQFASLFARYPRDLLSARHYPLVNARQFELLRNFIVATMARVAPVEFLGPHLNRELAMDVCKDLRSTALQAQVQQPAMWQDFDRLAAEASFRVNVGIAFIGLISTLAVMSRDYWWLFAVVGALAMVGSGVRRQQAANNYLIELIVSGVIKARLIDEAYELARRRVEAEGDPAEA